jgi:hypothetical protein
MYLLLGDQKSTICTAMLELLKAEGHNARIIENPLLSPFCFSMRLDTFASASWLTWEDGTHLSDKEIEGVLVGRPGRIPSEGWELAELSYAEQENRAALLAWLWSLECPVVNRYPAAVWYQPDLPLLFWQAQLELSGLSTLPSLITNVEQEADDFVAGLGTESVFAPLTAGVRYPLASNFDPRRLGAIQSRMPVHLTGTSGTPKLACLVGSRVVWDEPAPADVDQLEWCFKRFSALVGLDFLEFAVARTADGPRMAAVHAFPRIENFASTTQHQILLTLIQLLTGAELSAANPTIQVDGRTK